MLGSDPCTSSGRKQHSEKETSKIPHMHLQITFGVNMSEVEIFVTGKLKKRKKQKYRRVFRIKRIFLKVTVANRCVFEQKKSHQKTRRQQQKQQQKKFEHKTFRRHCGYKS